MLIKIIGAIFDFWSGRTCPPLGRTGNKTGEDSGGQGTKWGGLGRTPKKMGRTANKTGEETLIQPELTHTVSRIINPDHIFSIPDHF